MCPKIHLLDFSCVAFFRNQSTFSFTGVKIEAKFCTFSPLYGRRIYESDFRFSLRSNFLYTFGACPLHRLRDSTHSHGMF